MPKAANRDTLMTVTDPLDIEFVQLIRDMEPEEEVICAIADHEREDVIRRASLGFARTQNASKSEAVRFTNRLIRDLAANWRRAAN